MSLLAFEQKWEKLNRKKKIYSSGHGQTDFNFKGVVQGKWYRCSCWMQLAKHSKGHFSIPINRFRWTGLFTWINPYENSPFKKLFGLSIPSKSLPDLNEFLGENMRALHDPWGRWGYSICWANLEQGNLDYSIEGGGEARIQVAVRMRNE